MATPRRKPALALEAKTASGTPSIYHQTIIDAVKGLPHADAKDLICSRVHALEVLAGLAPAQTTEIAGT